MALMEALERLDAVLDRTLELTVNPPWAGLLLIVSLMLTSRLVASGPRSRFHGSLHGRLPYTSWYAATRCRAGRARDVCLCRVRPLVDYGRPSIALRDELTTCSLLLQAQGNGYVNARSSLCARPAILRVHASAACDASPASAGQGAAHRARGPARGRPQAHGRLVRRLPSGLVELHFG